MIYVDGASITYGDGLHDPQNEAWPACLSRQLDVTVINNSKVGKSNEHMIFDTINFCLDTKPKLAIVTFSPITRKFFVRRENNHHIDITPSSSNSVYQNHKELQQFQTLLFKYWSNHLNDCWKFLQSIICLQSFFKSYNIPYLLLNADDQSTLISLLTISSQSVKVKDQLLDAFSEMSDEEILKVEKQLKTLYDNIDHENFYKFEWHFRKLTYFTNHPTADQHKIIANFVSTIIDGRYD